LAYLAGAENRHAGPAEPAQGAPQTTRLDAIDGLRGTIIFVLIVHFDRIGAVWVGHLERAYYLVVQLGMLSMEVFFVVSGFLITGILLDSKGGRGYFRNFYVRRALRIMPLFYGFLCVWLLLLPALTRADLSQLTNGTYSQLWIWLHLTNVVQALGGGTAAPRSLVHFWSLSVEEQYYLFWPFVVFFCDRRRLKLVCLALILAAPAIRLTLVESGSAYAAYVLTPGRMDGLALGSLLAMLAREPGGLARFTRWAWPIAVLAFTAVLVIFAVLGEAVGHKGHLYNTVGLTASAFLAGSLLVLALSGRLGTLGNRLLTMPPLTILGRHCYGIYVVHVPLHVALGYAGFRIDTVLAWMPFGPRLAAQMVYTSLLTLLSLGIAILIWHGYEKHFLKLGKRFPYGTGRPAADRQPTAARPIGQAGAGAPPARYTISPAKISRAVARYRR
jgi:peptidoglycan/LPS O-acetylase OafA/YrhL